MNSLLSQTVWEKIESDFDSLVQAEITELLSYYDGNEQERVQLDILRLANGSREEVSVLVDEANKDYRNIIYWAEYPEESRIDTPEKRQQMRDLFQWLGLEVPSDMKEPKN